MEKRKRRDAGNVQITQRDIYVLTWIGEQRAISFSQLQHLLGSHAKAETKVPHQLSYSATRNALERWRRLGLVSIRKIINGEPAAIWLTQRGLTYLELSYPYNQPRPRTITEIYRTNDERLFCLQNQ